MEELTQWERRSRAQGWALNPWGWVSEGCRPCNSHGPRRQPPLWLPVPLCHRPTNSTQCVPVPRWWWAGSSPGPLLLQGGGIFLHPSPLAHSGALAPHNHASGECSQGQRAPSCTGHATGTTSAAAPADGPEPPSPLCRAGVEDAGRALAQACLLGTLFWGPCCLHPVGAIKAFSPGSPHGPRAA